MKSCVDYVKDKALRISVLRFVVFYFVGLVFMFKSSRCFCVLNLQWDTIPGVYSPVQGAVLVEFSSVFRYG